MKGGEHIRVPGLLRAARYGVLVLVLAGALSFAVAPGGRPRETSATSSAANGPMIGDCPIFPADNVWNTPIDRLPLDPNSAVDADGIGRTAGLHPDFGAGEHDEAPIGIPFIVVPPDQAQVPVAFEYDDDLHELQGRVRGSDFEAVDQSSLRVSEDSAQAR